MQIPKPFFDNPSERGIPICLGATPALQRTLVFDRVTNDSVNRATRCFETASGKSINAARVLRELGEQPLALGFVGGNVADAIRTDLDHAGIRHNLVTVTANTRTCTTVLDLSAGTATELVEEPRAVGTEAWATLMETLRYALPSAGVLILSGSLPPGAQQDFYTECISLGGAAGVPVLLDAAGEPLRRALRGRPWMVKPNRKELADAVEMNIASNESAREALRRLTEAGAQRALVTLGADGAMVTDGHSCWSVTLPPVRAINPIGSGDAVAAGLAVAHLHDWPVQEAARLAVACGAANALTEIAGHLNAGDLPGLFEQVKVVRL